MDILSDVVNKVAQKICVTGILRIKDVEGWKNTARWFEVCEAVEKDAEAFLAEKDWSLYIPISIQSGFLTIDEVKPDVNRYAIYRDDGSLAIPYVVEIEYTLTESE